MCLATSALEMQLLLRSILIHTNANICIMSCSTNYGQTYTYIITRTKHPLHTYDCFFGGAATELALVVAAALAVRGADPPFASLSDR